MNDDRAHDALALAERGARRTPSARARPRPRPWSWPRTPALTRFANSQIHQNVAETNVVVNLRFVVGKRVGVASTGRTDEEGLRRAGGERAAAIARVVEELEDWAGLPGPTPVEAVDGRPTPPATADATPELRAEGVRAVIAAADAAGRHRLRLVLDRHGDRSPSPTRRASAPAGTRTVAQLLTVSMGPDGGTGYAEQAAVDATTIDAAAIGREAADKARATANAGRHRCRRLPGRPRGVRGRRHPRHARLPRLLGPRRPGGAQLRRDRQARSARELVTIVDDGRDPAGPADGLRLRGRRQAARAARWRPGSAAASCYDAQTAARDGVGVRPATACPAPNPYGPVPAQHGHGARATPRATSSSAGSSAACS